MSKSHTSASRTHPRPPLPAPPAFLPFFTYFPGSPCLRGALILSRGVWRCVERGPQLLLHLVTFRNNFLLAECGGRDLRWAAPSLSPCSHFHPPLSTSLSVASPALPLPFCFTLCLPCVFLPHLSNLLTNIQFCHLFSCSASTSPAQLCFSVSKEVCVFR